MAAPTISGISRVQAATAYGGTESDVSSLQKQRDRLLAELDKLNAAQGGANEAPYRREQLQRQIRLLEAQLVQRTGSVATADFVPASPLTPVTLTPSRTERLGFLRGIGTADPATATVDRQGHFDALI
ncbi:hypothetical protein F4V43_06835 [Paenibacillus spiritus]|uniref:Uncharacterized protein n=1 Tax=Paenibacillus spiritus TaxID=2496557 RepID=A0A5J5GDD5_9BACL|nr:FlxA-like family protein [Paenibacillus spiritus]KAA9005792.1 hypothetical protein F4V43_06835 [Paenibacillus spiritus]